MLTWHPIATAPKDGTTIFARDASGYEQWTKFDMGDWCYEGWFTDADGFEYPSEDWWEPVEWAEH